LEKSGKKSAGTGAVRKSHRPRRSHARRVLKNKKWNAKKGLGPGKNQSLLGGKEMSGAARDTGEWEATNEKEIRK